MTRVKERSTCLLLTLLCSVTLAFDPGCSFVGDQCMYHVTLGHKDSCDARAGSLTSEPSGQSCCDDVTKMKTDITSMQIQIGDLVEQLAGLTSNPGSPDTSQLELTLNHTLAQLQLLKSHATSEIAGLRADLANLTQELQLCRTALGVATEDPRPASLSGDAHLTYCGFNNDSSDWCMFKSLTADDNFRLMKHGSSSSTGPLVDHSSGTKDFGQYVGLDSSSVGRNHIKYSSSSSSHTAHWAKLESDWLPPASAYCLAFWYNMRGRDVQSLEVTVRVGGGTGYPVFSKSGEQGQGWKMGQVDLTSEYTAQRFKIDFQASSIAYLYKYSSSSSGSLRSQYGDIAFDDVYIYNTSCRKTLQCPPNAYQWLNPATNKTACYTIHSTPLTWDKAYDVCRREGPKSYLLRIDSQAEQSFLVNLINGNDALRAVGVNGFYTGGNDFYTEHNFRWTEGGVLDPMIYTNWHANQPNNVGGDQNCLLMEYPEDGFSWGDVGCWSSHPFICEGHYD